MDKEYLVVEDMDVDGGFGDAVLKQIPLTSFTNLKQAKAYVKKYSKPVLYSSPYDDLYCGKLEIKTIAYNTIKPVSKLSNYVNANDLKL